VAWMDMFAWDKCGDDDLSEEDFKGDECIGALDLASKIDIAAKIKMFRRNIDGKDHYYLFLKSYLPELAIETSSNDSYRGWVEDGWITKTPGNIIDYAYIENDLIEDASKYEFLEIPYDPYQATQLVTRMTEEGLPMVELRPNVLNFSEPMKELEALVIAGRLHHNNNPVLTWMVSNVICHHDAKDNIYPRKESADKKIDGVVAAIMALARFMAMEDYTSVYDKRGVIVV
jgi:phage terminase large subunit-like protein